jgi:hypothetical protein
MRLLRHPRRSFDIHLRSARIRHPTRGGIWGAKKPIAFFLFYKPKIFVTFLSISSEKNLFEIYLFFLAMSEKDFNRTALRQVDLGLQGLMVSFSRGFQ